jgi:hypothetical protein
MTKQAMPTAEKNKKIFTERQAVKLIMDVFESHHAFDEKEAIGIDSFRNVPMTSQEIVRILIAYISHQIIVRTDNNKYYLDAQKWRHKARAWRKKRLLMQLVLFGIVIPVIVIVLFFLFRK